MKRSVYLACFVLLGFLVQMLAHALVEMIVLRYVSWDAWHPLWHSVVGGTLLAAGLGLGVQQGVYWWKEIYVKKRYGWVKD